MSDLEFKCGLTADISGTEGNYEVEICYEEGGTLRILNWHTNPEAKARMWVAAYDDALNGDNNVEADYADLFVELAAANERIRELEKENAGLHYKISDALNGGSLI